jgi:ABC-type sugar transport system ATPase subunit
MGRALVREPAVFLLDEPLSNLDARLRAQVREEIAELQQRTQTTMIYVTHDQTEAMTLGSRVAILDRGRLQQVAPAREIYERPANTFVAGFVGSPPMNLFPTRLLRASGGGLRMAVGDQDVAIAPVRPARAELESWLDRPLTAGLRPESLRIAAAAEDAFVATAEQVEFLGHETLVRARAGGGAAADSGVLLALRMAEPREVARGARLRVALDPARVHLFDAEDRALGEAAP